MNFSRSPGLRRAAEAGALALAGAVTGAAFLPGGPWWALWFSCAPLFALATGKSPAGAFLSGWIFGAGVWVSGTYWLAGSMASFLQVPYCAGLALFLAVSLWHGLMFGLLALAARAGGGLLEDGLGWPAPAALLCSSLPAMAALEGFFPVLFPVYFASALGVHPPAVQILELTGPAGVSALVLGVNIALFLLLKALAAAVRRGGSRAEAARAAALLGAVASLAFLNEGYGRLRLRQLDAVLRASGGGPGVVLLQAAVPVSPGGAGGTALKAYQALTARAVRESGPELVIWPESVYGGVAEYSVKDGRAAFSDKFRGALLRDLPGEFSVLMNSRALPAGAGGPAFNAAYSAGPDRSLLGLAAKRRLFPFGEYMPMGNLFPALYKLSPRTDSGLRRGAVPVTLPAPGGRLGALICYEDLYPSLAAELARKGAGLLVNLSNGEGFASAAALRQHLSLSALRAVENRRFFLRAANTGVSAVVDPGGRVLSSLEPWERGYLHSRPRFSEDVTFYSRHEPLIRFAGPFLLVLLSGLALAWRKLKGGAGAV